MRWGSRSSSIRSMSHTSDQHRLVRRQPRRAATAPHADWYVWADAKPDGSPPNNWQSVFGGPAWTWDARRGQYYLHNFLSEQPQLNVHNPRGAGGAARCRALLARCAASMASASMRSISRCTIPRCATIRPRPTTGAPRTRPFDFQLHLYNQSHRRHPAVPRASPRADSTAYGGRFTVAEVGGADAEREMKLFTRGDRAPQQRLRLRLPLRRSADRRRWSRAAIAQWPDDAPASAGRAGRSRTTTRRAPSRAGPTPANTRRLRADEDAAAALPARQHLPLSGRGTGARRRSTSRSSACRTPKRSPTGR